MFAIEDMVHSEYGDLLIRVNDCVSSQLKTRRKYCSTSLVMRRLVFPVTGAFSRHSSGKKW